MPRGKISKVSADNDAEVLEKEKPVSENEDKKSAGAAVLKIVSPETNEDNTEQGDVAKPLQDIFTIEKPESANGMNFKFTLLLVALFVAVNIGLVSMLNKEDKTANEETAVSKTQENKVEAPQVPATQEQAASEKSAPKVTVAAPAQTAPAVQPVPVNATPVPAAVVAPAAVTTPAKITTAKPVTTKSVVVKPVVKEDLLDIISKD